MYIIFVLYSHRRSWSTKKNGAEARECPSPAVGVNEEPSKAKAFEGKMNWMNLVKPELSKPIESVILRLDISSLRHLLIYHVNIHIIRHGAQHSDNTARYTDCSKDRGRWRNQKHSKRKDSQKHRHQTHNNESAPADYLMTNCKCGEFFKRNAYIYRLAIAIANRMQQFMNRHQQQSGQNPDRYKSRVNCFCPQPMPLDIDYQETE